jgi:hypothetical protein
VHDDPPINLVGRFEADAIRLDDCPSKIRRHFTTAAYRFGECGNQEVLWKHLMFSKFFEMLGRDVGGVLRIESRPA